MIRNTSNGKQQSSASSVCIYTHVETGWVIGVWFACSVLGAKGIIMCFR